MSALTLTVPITYTHPREEVSRNIMVLGGHTFEFRRDFTGEGLWYTAERIGTHPANAAVPLMLQGDLTKEAKRKGMTETHNFLRNIPKPEKPAKTPRAKGERKTSQPSGLKAAFNPFTM